MMKYLVAPAQMPDSLTWFKWEAYTTWLSGFALLVLVYYLGADLFLIDKSVLDLTAVQAAGIAFVSLVVAWLAYEGLCRSPLGRHEVALALVGYAFLVALTYGFTHVFSGRGAFTQIGAIIGTIMVANVFVIIIPYQKKTVAAMLVGKSPDPAWGALGKQRSVHNNYLTLPVVFLMLSNHYPLFFATRFNWLIVAIVLAIGPVIRHFFNSRHEGKGSPWWTWGVAAAGMAAVAWLSAAGPPAATVGALPPTPKFADVSNIVDVTLRDVPRRRTGLGRHRDGAERRLARYRRAHPAARAADRDRCGALERHAARQHHGNDRRRAPCAGIVARLRRTGAVIEVAQLSLRS